MNIKKHLFNQILRVNHAGELGAKYIYQGQIKATSCPEKCKILEKMLDQELKHLSYFDSALQKHKTRPSLLLPIWDKLSFLMGYVTAKIDYKSAMACTEAVESIIVSHYQGQLDTIKVNNLSDLDPELQEKIQVFLQEELEHHDIAIEHDSVNSPQYHLVYNIIKLITKIAIQLSKRI